MKQTNKNSLGICMIKQNHHTVSLDYAHAPYGTPPIVHNPFIIRGSSIITHLTL